MVNLVTLPSVPGFESVDFSFTDSVAINASPFTGQTQAQQWPGADMWSGTVNLPQLTQPQADAWLSALMYCRGMANAFLIGDPLKQTPAGVPLGTPVIDMTLGTNAVGAQLLDTRGWATGGSSPLLVPGDYVQIGYRLHRVVDILGSFGGTLRLSIWPSIRDVLTDGETVVTSGCQGLFRLASNKRNWSADFTKMTRLSFPIMEYR